MEPYLTIAAQTAPGRGIVLKNYSLSTFTHDIIICGLRIRPGDGNIHNGADTRDCITMQTGSHHIIIDHCSMSWAIDENLNVWDSTEYITVQWNIISEGLYHSIHPKGPHSMGLLIGNGSAKTSVHHNLLAHNNARNPLLKGGIDHEFISNVIYDWGYSSEFFEDGSQLKVDISGNYWKPRTSIVDTAEMPLKLDFDSTTTLGSLLYCRNNEYVGINFLNTAQLQNMGSGSAALFPNSSVMDSTSTISFDFPGSANDTVLAWAGALHPQRDSTDTRVLTSVHDSTGGLVDCMFANPILLDSGAVMYGTDSSIIYSQLFVIPAISAEGRKVAIVGGTGAGQGRYGLHDNVIDSAQRIVEAVIDSPWTIIPDSTSIYEVIVTCDNAVGGWGAYAAGTPPADADHDGMPDAWEVLHGLNPNDSTDRNGTTLDSSGYTNLEVYLNEFYSPHAVNVVEEINNQNMIYVLNPDPFTTSATLQLSEKLTGAKLSIYNLFGEQLKVISNIYGNKVQLFRDDLKAGVYFFKIAENSRTKLFGRLVIAE